jgi:1,4-dihydroxy-2-naphthoyl-CoA synthase
MPLNLIDPEDPQFKGRSWLEIEDELDRREREDLAELGIELPPGMKKTQLLSSDVDGDVGLALPKEVSKPWEHPVGWGDLKPSCTSKNWKHKDVKLEIGDGIAYLTLNAPERKNSLNFDVQDAFQDACMELQTRKDIRVVVLKAEGSMFCSGGDPKWFQDCAKLPDEENNKGSMQFAKFLYMFQTLPQLTIAMVQGHAMGGGVGLASICDVVIAIKNAQFVLSEVRLGVIPATISPYVVAKIGVANAKRLFCTAENLKAEEARQMGLVQ